MKYKFKVALSYAFEDKEVADPVARALRNAGVKVFYDDFYEEELWGEDLSILLKNVYFSDSQYCIMIVSHHYVNKMWSSHERQQATERMIKEKGKTYLLPVRLDDFDGEIPGLSGSIGYLSVRKTEYQKIVDAFLRKIGRKDPSKPIYKTTEKPIKINKYPISKRSLLARKRNNSSNRHLKK